MKETLITVLIIMLTFMVIIGYVGVTPFLGLLIISTWLLGGKGR